MINHESIFLACRAKLDELSVASVTAEIIAETDGFRRYSGSWVDDGYAPGMRVTVEGFAEPGNDGVFTVTEVDAGKLTVDATLTEELYGSTDLITNGSFDVDASGWTVTPAFYYQGDPWYFVNSAGFPQGEFSQTVAITAGVAYRLQYTVSVYTLGTLEVALGGAAGTPTAANGTVVDDIVAGSADSLLKFDNGSVGPYFVGAIDDVSLVGPPIVTVSVATPDIATENVKFEPVARVPYFREEYLPGPMTQVTLGGLAELEVLPNFVVTVFVPSDTATRALRKYADALLTLFAPGTALTVTDHTVWVRRDIAPFAAQALQLDGWAYATVTVPLRVRTANSI